MTDQPVVPPTTEAQDVVPPATPAAAAEPATEPGADETAASTAPITTSRRPADRMQQILTALALLLIFAAAVLLTIAIVNQ